MGDLVELSRQDMCMRTQESRLDSHTVEFALADTPALSALCKHPRYGGILRAAMKVWSDGVRVCRGQYGVTAESGVFTLTAESACLIGAALVGAPSASTAVLGAETQYNLRSDEVTAIVQGVDCATDARRAQVLTEVDVVTNLEAFEFGQAIASALGLPFTYMSCDATKA